MSVFFTPLGLGTTYNERLNIKGLDEIKLIDLN